MTAATITRTTGTLVVLAQQGDQGAFEVLYRAAQPRLRQYVNGRVRDRALAEDITSQALAKAWRHLDGFRGGDQSFGAWTQAIAHRLIIDHQRTAAVRHADGSGIQPCDLALPDPAQLVEDTAVGAISVRAALDLLSPVDREVVVRRHLLDQSPAAVSAAMGITAATVKSTLRHATTYLARYLTPKGA
jgi:RNA polymerase sigma-70 factor (ECF subfamily)